MRWLALALAALIGCRTSDSPAPLPVVPAPLPSSSASIATVVPDAAPDVVPLLDDDLGGALGFARPSPALLERLNREWNAIPKGKLDLHPKPDRERDDFIKQRFGQDCSLERTCGPLWGVDCHAAIDGPYYYVQIRPDRIEAITTCGGACMSNRCTNCPPKKEGWTCPVY